MIVFLFLWLRCFFYEMPHIHMLYLYLIIYSSHKMLKIFFAIDNFSLKNKVFFYKRFFHCIRIFWLFSFYENNHKIYLFMPVLKD